MTQYKVIIKRSVGSLQSAVNDHLDNGWRLHGGYFFYKSGNLLDSENHCQAVVNVE